MLQEPTSGLKSNKIYTHNQVAIAAPLHSLQICFHIIPRMKQNVWNIGRKIYNDYDVRMYKVFNFFSFWLGHILCSE